MSYWLLKSEPSVFSIDDLRKARTTQWDGVRNYQARNFLQAMKPGEQVLFYHSSTEIPGVAGIAAVKKTAYPDQLQYKKNSEYFEPRATPEKPVWFAPDVEFVQKCSRVVTLTELRAVRELQRMELLKRGSRLSVQPVTEGEFKKILSMATAE